MQSSENPIFIISDGTGETAEKVVHAALRQFKEHPVTVRLFPNVTTPAQLHAVIGQAAEHKALVVTTLVSPEMRTLASDLSNKHQVSQTDVIGSLLGQLTQFLHSQPQGVPGLMHQADDAYFKRIEAVEFTVKADDGKEPRMLLAADIILVGVSRTSKTPLSIFLAHKGYKVSNIPLILERPIPKELSLANPNRVFALTIDPESLQEIRNQRLKTMRVQGRSNYSDMSCILAELDWAEDLFRRHQSWPVIDVTRKAVEETAALIIEIMTERGLTTHLSGSTREVGQL